MGTKTKQSGWEAAALRTREGKKHEFECMDTDPKFWFIPCKYSVEGSTAIQQMYMEMKESLSAGIIQKMADSAQAGKSQREIMDSFTPAEMGEFLKHVDLKKITGPAMIRAKLKYGFGKNNFPGEDPLGAMGNEGELKEEFLDRLMKYENVVREALKAIEEANPPLAKKPPRA